MVAMVYEGLRLRVGPVISPSYHLHTGVETEPAHGFHVAIHLIQVCTLNAWVHHCDSRYTSWLSVFFYGGEANVV